MMKSYSQAGQDKFVITCLKNKSHGTFIDIGANHPITNSNTYLLETQYKWRGILVEYDSSFKTGYSQLRCNSVGIINDATKVDYKALLREHDMPTSIDYLQIDLDVDNGSTIKTLELFDKTIFDSYKFATVTFEHDIYTGDFFDTRQQSREIFKKHGYKLVFPDVKVFWENDWRPFEDWYVHPDLVDMEYINTFATEESLSQERIITILENALK